jgi:hypothetical protein
MSLIFIAGIVKDRIKQHMVLLSISHLLERMGLKIVPYYVTRESLFDRKGSDFEPDLKPVVSGFLSQSEIERLYCEPETKGLRKEMGKWKDNHCLCFGLKHNDEIVAYMWCNLRFCNSDIVSFPLQPDEAYLL